MRAATSAIRSRWARSASFNSALGFQRGVTLAAQALDLIDHGHGLGMELDDLPVELPSIGEISDARGMELVVLELEARGIEFELLLYKGDPLIAVGLNLFIPIRRLGELAAEFIHLGHEQCVLGPEVGSLAQQLLPPCRLDPLGGLIEDGLHAGCLADFLLARIVCHGAALQSTKGMASPCHTAGDNARPLLICSHPAIGEF